MMAYFSKRFPDIGPRETRVVILEGPGDGEAPPPGRYAFLEMYCDEVGCHCRRVLIRVVEESTPGKIWASISYSWDPGLKLEQGSRPLAVAGTSLELFLDPIWEQSEYAEDFLDLFQSVILPDAAYVERLKRHYDMVKAKPERKQSWQRPHTEARAKRARPEQIRKRLKSR